MKGEASYVSGGQHGPPTWKPTCFNPAYILFISILHILYIIGIQLVARKIQEDQSVIQLVQKNVTVTNPQSIFIFDEENTAAYLAWQYFPVAIATIIAIFWEILDITVRRLEPFYQLSRSEGGTAANAMCLDYISMFAPFVPFRAMSHRHYVVVLCSSIYLIASLVTPALAGGIWTVEFSTFSYAAGQLEGPKLSTITMNSGIAIATQVFHGINAAMGCLAAVILFRRRTPLYHDPKGIGGIASLICDGDRTHANVLHIFRQMPSWTHSGLIPEVMRDVRFKLQEVSVVRRDGLLYPAYQITAQLPQNHRLALPQNAWNFSHDRWDATGIWLTKRAAFIAEAVIWLSQAAIALAIFYVAKATGGERFAESNRATIAKMVYTLTLSIGGMMWQSIQRELQVFEPWRRLSESPRKTLYHALVESDVISLGLIGSLLLSTVRLSLVAAWMSFAVGMVSVATVFIPPLLELSYAAGLAPISNAATQYPMPYSTMLALAITGITIHLVIFVNMLFVMVSGRTRPFLPRRPTTIASQILYLCRSDKLLANFAQLSMHSKGKLSEELGHKDQACRFGWFWWPRGQVWCIGVEEYRQGDQWHPFNFYGSIDPSRGCT